MVGKMKFNITQKIFSEFLGTLFLLVIVVGSGVMGERLSAGNIAIALLANSLATGLGLVFLIWIFGPISGAHFNPIVSVVSFFQGHHSKKETLFYILAQFVAAVVGVCIAHIMFSEPVIAMSVKDRSGFSLIFSECVATFGLLMVIHGLFKNHNEKIPMAVGAYIASAYWFTASTSFANPAVTLARAFTPTFSGIAINNVLGFVAAQIIGGALATVCFRWLLKDQK